MQNRQIHFISPYRHDHLILLSDILDYPVNNIGQSWSPVLTEGVVNQRLYKSEEEIAEIEHAVDITSEMHLAAMKMARPGIKEQHVVARLLEIATSHGGFYSFPPIVAINGETLHNHYYGNTLQKGNLLLVDAGAENDMGYAGDMTRTFPVGQKFSIR
jgi:Xaa-Pro aminopeptidase